MVNLIDHINPRKTFKSSTALFTKFLENIMKYFIFLLLILILSLSLSAYSMGPDEEISNVDYRWVSLLLRLKKYNENFEKKDNYKEKFKETIKK